jgi:hypothetical protein
MIYRNALFSRLARNDCYRTQEPKTWPRDDLAMDRLRTWLDVKLDLVGPPGLEPGTKAL